MKVRSVIAAFALVGATSAAPSIQNIEERQAPTCGVVGNDKGWYIYSQTGQTITNCYSLCQQRSDCLSYSFGQTRCRLYNDYAVNQVVRNAAAPYTFYGKGCARPATTTTRRTTTTTRPVTSTTRPITTTTRPITTTPRLSTTTPRPITTTSSVRPTSSTTSRASTTSSRPASSTTTRVSTTTSRASTTVAVTTSSSSSSSRPVTSSTTSRPTSSTTSAGTSAESASVRSSTTTTSKSLLTDPLDPATAGPILTSTSGSPSSTSRGSASSTSSGSSSSTSSGVSISTLSSSSTGVSSSTSSSRPASSSTTLGVSTTGSSSATSTVSTTRSAASSSTPSSTTRSPTSSTLSSTTRSTTLSTTTSTTRSTTRSTTTSTTSTACKPVPTASSGKRGLSFNDPKFTNLFSATSCTPNSVGRSRTSWAYNWFSAPCDNFNHASLCSVPFNPYLEFIPMLWSNDRDLQIVWNSNVQAAAARGWKTVLAFNEPDIAHSGGSGMSIADAVTSWKQYIQPLKAQGFRLGSPAVTNAQGLNMGNDWQVKFLDQTPGKGGCIGCTVDFLAVHWYGGPTDFDSFFNHVAYSWSVVGGQRMPVWITEFGITGGTDAQVENFLRVVIDAFENQPYWSFVERYAWFVASNSSPTSGPLVAANGTSLSRAGQVYENQV